MQRPEMAVRLRHDRESMSCAIVIAPFPHNRFLLKMTTLQPSVEIVVTSCRHCDLPRAWLAQRLARLVVTKKTMHVRVRINYKSMCSLTCSGIGASIDSRLQSATQVAYLLSWCIHTSTSPVFSLTLVLARLLPLADTSSLRI